LPITRLRRGRPFAALVWVLALVTLALAGQDLLPHTDDGCAVEVHCVLCRTAAVHPGTAIAIAQGPAQRVLARDWPAAEATGSVLDTAFSSTDPRGPPRGI
jgi:hypothetical protein